MITPEEKIRIHDILLDIKERQDHSISKVEFDILCNNQEHIISTIIEEDMVESEDEDDMLYLSEFGFSILEQKLLLPEPSKAPSLKTAFEKVQKSYVKKETKPSYINIYIWFALGILVIGYTMMRFL